MVQDFLIISAKHEKRGIRVWRYSPFFRKICSEKVCSFWFTTGTTGFSVQKKSSHYHPRPQVFLRVQNGEVELPEQGWQIDTGLSVAVFEGYFQQLASKYVSLQSETSIHPSWKKIFYKKILHKLQHDFLSISTSAFWRRRRTWGRDWLYVI